MFKLIILNTINLLKLKLFKTYVDVFDVIYLNSILYLKAIQVLSSDWPIVFKTGLDRESVKV